jgi:hypothetical protein
VSTRTALAAIPTLSLEADVTTPNDIARSVARQRGTFGAVYLDQTIAGNARISVRRGTRGRVATILRKAARSA